MLTEQAKQISSLVAALKQARAGEARLKLRLRSLKPSTVEAAAREAETSLREAKADLREARGLLAKREAVIGSVR